MQAFRNVGLSLAVDGSEDEQLKIRDLSDLVIGDWQREEEVEELSEYEDGEPEEDSDEDRELGESSHDSSHGRDDVLYDFIIVATGGA